MGRNLVVQAAAGWSSLFLSWTALRGCSPFGGSGLSTVVAPATAVNLKKFIFFKLIPVLVPVMYRSN